MADVVRILGLDDDNHAPVFRMETGEIFETPRELIEFLSHSHDVEYDVRMFNIILDLPRYLTELYGVDEVIAVFESLMGTAPWCGGEFKDAFDFLWESANRGYW